MIGPICLAVAWLGVAWALDWSGFFHGPQGQTLEGYERVLASLCWPYVMAVMLIVTAVIGLYIGISWLRGR